MSYEVFTVSVKVREQLCLNQQKTLEFYIYFAQRVAGNN